MGLKKETYFKKDIRNEITHQDTRRFTYLMIQVYDSTIVIYFVFPQIRARYSIIVSLKDVYNQIISLFLRTMTSSLKIVPCTGTVLSSLKISLMKRTVANFAIC